MLLKYVSQSALATRWIYLEKAKIPAPRSDHASVIRETVSVTEESHTIRDVEVFRDDVAQHVAVLKDVFPLLVTCDEKLRKDWERNQHLFQPAIERMGRWAERWRKAPRTKAGLVTPSRSE